MMLSLEFADGCWNFLNEHFYQPAASLWVLQGIGVGSALQASKIGHRLDNRQRPLVWTG